MKASYRRQRRVDQLASPQAVRSILQQLRSELPEMIPLADNDLIKMLRAVRHVQKYRATDTRRGRPGRWSRETLLNVGTRLSEILSRETSSNISISSFVDHYLRILDFPSDVVDALALGYVNLFEAEQLARISPARINGDPAEAHRLRAELLATHRSARLSGERLRQRTAELLGAFSNETTAGPESGFESDLEDFDPYDSTHLFWDQIKQLGFALRDIRSEDLRDEEIDELLRVSEPVLQVLSRIQRRKERKAVRKLVI